MPCGQRAYLHPTYTYLIKDYAHTLLTSNLLIYNKNNDLPTEKWLLNNSNNKQRSKRSYNN